MLHIGTVLIRRRARKQVRHRVLHESEAQLLTLFSDACLAFARRFVTHLLTRAPLNQDRAKLLLFEKD